MKIKAVLVSYEWRMLERLEEEYKLDGRLVNGFGKSLVDLRALCRKAIVTPDGEFRAGRVVVVGLINQTGLLLMGGLRSLEDGNGIVWSSCARSLIEVFGACVLIQKKRSFAPNFLNHVSVGKLYNAAKQAVPELAPDIQRLHEIVHPGSRAVLAGHRIADPTKEEAEFRYGIVSFSPQEAREGVTVLANMALQIVEKLRLIVADAATLQEGKVIMRSRTCKPI